MKPYKVTIDIMPRDVSYPQEKRFWWKEKALEHYDIWWLTLANSSWTGSVTVKGPDVDLSYKKGEE